MPQRRSRAPGGAVNGHRDQHGNAGGPGAGVAGTLDASPMRQRSAGREPEHCSRPRSARSIAFPPRRTPTPVHPGWRWFSAGEARHEPAAQVDRYMLGLHTRFGAGSPSRLVEDAPRPLGRWEAPTLPGSRMHPGALRAGRLTPGPAGSARVGYPDSAAGWLAPTRGPRPTSQSAVALRAG